MNENTEENKIESVQKQEKKPNEDAGFYFSSSLKVFDPNTGEVLVKIRGDN